MVFSLELRTIGPVPWFYCGPGLIFRQDWLVGSGISMLAIELIRGDLYSLPPSSHILLVRIYKITLKLFRSAH